MLKSCFSAVRVHLCIAVCSECARVQVYAPKLQFDACTLQRVVLHSLVLQCALSHYHYADSLCLCGTERYMGHRYTTVCSLCMPRTKHPEA